MPTSSPRPLAVVKLGGSLFGAPRLGALLDVAARHGALVVPGGGPFADAVRALQPTLGFDDRAAHEMAILAMAQGAALIQRLRPDFDRVASMDEIERARAAGRAALWWPVPLALEADVPASWDVTSDSLALWLARAVGAARVVFVKSALAPVSSSIADWARDGLVDAHLPRLAQTYAGEALCVGDASPEALDAALAAPSRLAA
ncbi:aspartate kinase [Methylopila musalis]|uniref:Aspartate kinase n=1 Tax=Methylopila musalis TaxID=1134781 RepID=A0ABW3Z7C1_9HYPH